MNWTNESAAQAFSEIADLLEIKGENPFKIKAYLKASRVLRELEDDLEVVRAEGRLRSIPGVGKAIADKLEAFLQTGSIPQLEELREEIPAGVSFAGPAVVEQLDSTTVIPPGVKVEIDQYMNIIMRIEEA